MQPRLAVLILAEVVLLTTASLAQGSARLVGAWERFALRDSVGTEIQPPNPAAFAIFSAEGFYAQLAMPKDRPKVTESLADMTKEELLARFTDVESRWGPYTVSGDTLSRTYFGVLDPNPEGGPAQVQKFRIEGDVLILSSFRPGMRDEARFRRIKKRMRRLTCA